MYHSLFLSSEYVCVDEQYFICSLKIWWTLVLVSMLRDGVYNCCEHSNIDLCVDMLLVLLDEHLRTRLLDHMDSICFTLLRNCQSFPNWLWHFAFLSVQFSSVAQSCLTLCDPMNLSTPGLPVHHQLPDPTQTRVHWVGDAIQPSHPLLSPSPQSLLEFSNTLLIKK